MPYSYVLTTTIPASPEEIYEAWLDSLGHSEMTGGAAIMSDQVGAEVSAWDGYIRGRNLELVPGERIVQSWRTTEFGDANEDSILTLVLREADDGTLLTLEHSNVPDEQRSYQESGWQEYYFEPMVAYFTERQQPPAAPQPAKKAAAKGAGKPSAKRAAKGMSKSASKGAAKRPRKAKRVASAKSKRAAPRKKAAAKKGKAKAGRAKAARRPKRGKRK